MSEAFAPSLDTKNFAIIDGYAKAVSVLSRSHTPLCSISGGSDSDIVLDVIQNVDEKKKVRYFWIDTGLEYRATKEHLDDLEKKYGIEIERIKACKPIPVCCKEYGQPFLSKYVSEQIMRLQQHGFQWEDKPLPELLEQYPNCKIALQWWCNAYYSPENGVVKMSRFSIGRNKWLKEFMMANPPDFKISNKCCEYAKKKPAKLLIQEYDADLEIIGVDYSEHTNTWHIENKRADSSVLSRRDFGTKNMSAYEIMEQLLNLKEPKVYKSETYLDLNGNEKERRVVDIKATKIVQQKAAKIKQAFKDWIFRDPERAIPLVEQYNRQFNSIRPREYDGSALRFPGMNSAITLKEHQKNAIAHALFGGNTLFAHCVGAGKTFEMIAAAMESKRLGLCTKPLFAVPNHLTEQIGEDFQKLYPGANILVATKNDFKKENRQQLFAKIATGDFDAVIIGHSQLGMIPLSKERQVSILQDQIDDIMAGIEELKKAEGSRFQVKQMERTKKSLEARLDKLEKTHDDILTFEEMGIDKLIIDEAHEFKNVPTQTKLTNVAGISSSASQKALDLFMKCRYLDEKTGGRGVIMATGTPLSNSVTELHTMMRFLEYDFLKDHGLSNFDNWVAVFGEQKTEWELAPAGNKFKERTRIANYTGLPELMSMFKQVADVRTADTLDLATPEMKYHIENIEATEFQKTLVQELSDRADDVQSGNIDPSVDNMLRITSDGRKLGLDPRLIDPSFEDSPDTKLNQCVRNVTQIYHDTAEKKLTQIIFCDLGVPKKNSQSTDKGENADEKSASERESLEEECDFCVYDDIRDKLIANGIKPEEIAYVHNAKTEQQKADLFDRVNKGEVRVLLGSTGKMGTGTNCQKKLIALHNLDIPWRPSDLQQRIGRIERQGNQNSVAHVFNYVTTSSERSDRVKVHTLARRSPMP